MIQRYYTTETHERFTAVWSGFLGAPTELSNWRRHFRNYIERRWFDSDHACAATHRDCHGLNAGEPALVPLILIAKANGTFDLTDALTFSVWMDYLNEFEERSELWQEFEAQCGVQEGLV